MSHTRSNGQGFAGGTGRKFNKLDSYIITREFEITATANASQIDTGIKLPARTQMLNGFIEVETAEATGLTKTLSIGVFGGASTAFILDADCSAVAPVGKVNNLTVQDTSVNNTIGYTFRSGDLAEFTGKVTLTFVVVD
jgi:hypothetical protein